MILDNLLLSMSKELPNDKTLSQIASLEYKIVEQQSLSEQFCQEDDCKNLYDDNRKIVIWIK